MVPKVKCLRFFSLALWERAGVRASVRTSLPFHFCIPSIDEIHFTNIHHGYNLPLAHLYDK
jgi:hypothetical protein